MNTYTSPASSNTDPLKSFMEDIEKTQKLSGKYIKIQTYIESLKEERSKIKDLDLPISKQFLDHAIKTLDVEHDIVLEKIDNVLKRVEITDVDVMPEEMIRGLLNLSPEPTNTVLQAPETSMQSQQGSLHQGLGQQGLLPQGLGQEGLLPQGSLQTNMQQIIMQQRQRQQQVLQQHQLRMQQRQQQVLQQQQQGLRQKQIMNASQLQQQQGLLTPQMTQLLQQQTLLQQQQGLLQPQIMKPSQLQQQARLLEQLGQQVFGQQG